MSAGSGDALKFSGNERGAVFNGRGSWRGRISGALIQGVQMKNSGEDYPDYFGSFVMPSQ